MQKTNEFKMGTSAQYQFDGGLSLYDETSIKLNQSPYGGLLNINLDNGGMPSKRRGQEHIYSTSLGAGGINGLYIGYKNKTIIAHNTKLYTQELSNQPQEIYSQLENAKTLMFVFNGILYIVNKGKYLQYDGTEVREVTPYVPNTVMNRKPDGSKSDINESWNMLGTGFKETFNGDGTSKTYKLSLSGLAEDKVTCNIGGVEGSGFTVNRNTGVVTFNSAPPEGLNNVEITAHKIFPGLKDNITNCTFYCEFSNRVFLSGNGKLANWYFASGVTNDYRPTYFPQKYQYAIGGEDKAITGFKVQYDTLIVFKENVTCTVRSALGLDNTASFPISFLNTEVGCDIPGSIQLINNLVIFANTSNGVHCIVSTDVPGEKNIKPISQNINGSYERPGLLQEDLESLKNGTSADFGYKYYLVVNGKAYILDYKDFFNPNKPNDLRWFLYDNFNANHFATYKNNLYYGDTNEGYICRLSNTYNDFGEPINAVWRSKHLDFGYPDYYKLIRELWFTTRANTNSSIKLTYYDDNGGMLDSQIIDKQENGFFSWNNFNWSSFTWKIDFYAPTFKRKIRLKNVRYFQIEFSNCELNEGLSIINLIIRYTLTKKVR